MPILFIALIDKFGTIHGLYGATKAILCCLMIAATSIAPANAQPCIYASGSDTLAFTSLNTMSLDGISRWARLTIDGRAVDCEYSLLDDGGSEIACDNHVENFNFINGEPRNFNATHVIFLDRDWARASCPAPVERFAR